MFDIVIIGAAIATKTVTRLSQTVKVPIIAGGLLEEKREIFAALSAGASAISTGSPRFGILHHTEKASLRRGFFIFFKKAIDILPEKS